MARGQGKQAVRGKGSEGSGETTGRAGSDGDARDATGDGGYAPTYGGPGIIGANEWWDGTRGAWYAATGGTGDGAGARNAAANADARRDAARFWRDDEPPWATSYATGFRDGYDGAGACDAAYAAGYAAGYAAAADATANDAR